MKELLNPKKRLLGGRELRFLSIHAPFLAVIVLAVGIFLKGKTDYDCFPREQSRFIKKAGCESSLRPKQMEHVEIIKDSAYSLLTVIDEPLDFSKIEAGKIDLEEEPVVLSAKSALSWKMLASYRTKSKFTC